MTGETEESPVRRAEAKSRQPRLSGASAAQGMWVTMIKEWTKDSIQDIPTYTTDSRKLDLWLSDFWRTETLLSGVVSNVVSIDKNRGWSLTGGRNQVSRFTRILREVEDGAGWRRYISMQSESFWTTNIGAISEVARIGEEGPLGGLYHVDPTRCVLTGKLDFPLEFYHDQKPQQWKRNDYMRATSMPMIQQKYNQLGYCAVMRAIQFTVLMVAIYRHDKEMLFALLPKGLLLMSGIDENDWEDAMETNKERLTQKEREFFAGLSVFFSGTAGEIDAKLVSLSQLPHGFDMQSWTNMLMYGYALVFGYDPREFWPVSGGSLGTGRESEIQALKASGKGGLDFALSFQDNLQRELPPTLFFEFDQRDEAGERSEYEAIKAYAEAVNEMAKASMTGGMETLAPEQRRILYAERGFIPEEWTLVEEDVTSTDTEGIERERLLSIPHVLRACETYKNQPIVKLSWDNGIGYTIRQLWECGDQALAPAAFYSFPRALREIGITAADVVQALEILRKPPVERQDEVDPETVYFEGEDFSITEDDVQRALRKWDARHDDEWAGLPEATSEELE